LSPTGSESTPTAHSLRLCSCHKRIDKSPGAGGNHAGSGVPARTSPRSVTSSANRPEPAPIRVCASVPTGCSWSWAACRCPGPPAYPAVHATGCAAGGAHPGRGPGRAGRSGAARPRGTPPRPTPFPGAGQHCPVATAASGVPAKAWSPASAWGGIAGWSSRHWRGSTVFAACASALSNATISSRRSCPGSVHASAAISCTGRFERRS